MQISKIKLARDPLHAVARGCLIAARTQEAGNRGKAATTTNVPLQQQTPQPQTQTQVESKPVTKKKYKKKK